MRVLLKNKWTKILATLAVVALLIGGTFMAKPNNGVAHTAKADTTLSGGWTAITATVGETDADGYTSLTNTGYGSRAYYNEPVTLDGLTIYHKVTDFNVTNNGYIGFGFSQTATGYPLEEHGFMAYYRRGETHDCLFYSTSHDHYSAENYVATKDEAGTQTGYGIDGAQFYGFTKSTTLWVSISFTKVSATCYKMVTTPLAGTEQGVSIGSWTTYFNPTGKGMTEDGKVYVVAIGETGKTAQIKLTTSGGLPAGWAAYNGANASVESDSTEIGIFGTTNYVKSTNKFMMNNFETTIRLGVEATDWFVVGLTKDSHFYASESISAEEYPSYYGVYLLFMKNSDTDYTVQVYNYQPITNPNTTSISYFDCMIAHDLSVSVGGDKLIKIRTYPDETGKYVQLNINGSMLVSNRLQASVMQQMFGEDYNANLLIQMCSTTACSYYVKTLNNKAATSSNVTVPDADNIPTYNTTYTVLWKNWDGTVLETDTVAYGEMPAYNGDTPTKPQTKEWTYAFKGWDSDVVAATEDISYTAEFEQSVRTYTVLWKNWDGTVLETDTVAYGETATYDGAQPSRENTEEYTYSFSGWDKEVGEVTDNVEVTAQYEQTANDTGSNTPEGGNPDDNTGSNTPEGGNPDDNTGSTTPDGGNPDDNTGSNTPDGGNPDDNTGSNTPDGGNPDDNTGSNTPEGGNPDDNTGSNTPEGENPDDNTGSTTPNENRGGCSAEVAFMMPTLLAMLAVGLMIKRKRNA